jgi:hypothetical protein
VGYINWTLGHEINNLSLHSKSTETATSHLLFVFEANFGKIRFWDSY